MPKIKNKITLGIRSKYAENDENSLQIKEDSNLGKLLLHALEKGNRHTIKTILCVDEDKIVQSVRKLRNDLAEELLEKLVAFMQKNVLLNDQASLWVKHILKTNETYLMDKPNIEDMLTPLKKVLQDHIDFQESLKGLQGKINFILNHMNKEKSDEANEIISNEDLDDDSIEKFIMHSPEHYSSDDLKDDSSDDLKDDLSDDMKDDLSDNVNDDSSEEEGN